MTKPDMAIHLRAVLGDTMTTAQRGSLDARLADRISGPPARASALRRRSFVVLLVILMLSTVAAVSVSAAMRLTEDPLGLASAGEFAQEIAAAEQIVPIPSAAAWPSYLAVTDSNASYARGGGRTQVEFVAVCLWSDSWLAADRSGDTAARVTAAATLDNVRTWQVYVGSDPIHGMRALLDRIADAAAHDDPGPIQSFVTINCGR